MGDARLARMLTSPQVFFQPASGRSGQRLYLFHSAKPADAGRSPRGAVLYIHPFAEEMNKSRRMAALQSRALASAGFAVLQVDLHGCGDSSGEFGDATWDDWVADIVEAADWLRQRCDAPVWLWGLRAGCLLATAAAARIQYPCSFLFWQPATTGKLLLQQFLRLKAAAQLADGGGKAILNKLKADLAAGKAVEVAGYSLHPQLASGLDAAALVPTALLANAGFREQRSLRRVVWLELSTLSDAGLSAPTTAALARWIDSGFTVTSSIIQGPMFWQTTEIEDAPALVAATVEKMLNEPVTA